ncbi:MAG: MarR family transcriptional regulator [Pirellulales bacterium]|nr:MarR family transcriptional regulator [Pirellulales bacterium]
MSTIHETSDSTVIDLLRKEGALGVSDLAAALDVTATAVRQRLMRLMSQGLVERESSAKAGRGRPSHRYRLTEKARRRAGTNFADLAMVLWHELGVDQEPAARALLMRRVAKALATHYLKEVQGASSEERMQAISTLFGHRDVPFTVDRANGLPVLRAHDCPYPDLADQDRTICELERLVFSELLAAGVELSQCRLDGQPCCQFEPRLS